MERLRIAAVVLIAGVAGWMVRGIEFQKDEPPAVIVSREDGEGSPSLQPQQGVLRYAQDDTQRKASRNIFAYVDPPPAPRKVPEMQLVANINPPRETLEKFVPLTPQPPRFTQRYIGTFGTDAVRLAAFARDDGEVINARIGDRIDANFTLQSIGLESVEVMHISTRTTQRVEMSHR